MRPTASTTRRAVAARLATVIAVGATLLVGPAGTPLAPAPAGATTASVSLQGRIDHKLSGIYQGDGPKQAYASPALADITGDNTPEIVIGSMDGTVEAYRTTDRSRLWSVKVGNTAIQASPTIADLGSDGKPDVIVGTMDGRVIWLNGPTGAIVRTFRQGAPLYCPPGTDCRPDGFFGTPTIADVNGDKILDIVASNYDHTIYAWSKTGTLLWRKFLEDSNWSSPTVADIDRDGKPEVIVGGDIYANNPLGKPEGGLIWVLHGNNGANYPGYPLSVAGQTVWSSPAIADLNGDKYPELVVGTGFNWPDPRGRQVRAITAYNRKNLPGWPVTVEGRVMGSPAIGDLDGDGKLEVSFASDGGWLYSYEANGHRNWRGCNATSINGCNTGYYTSGGTVIADVDADGSQEVISTLDKDLRIYDGKTGAVEDSYRLTDVGTLAPGSSPAVAEVNGKTVIAQSTVYRVNGHGGVMAPGDLTRVYLFATGNSLCRADWPQFHRDARRSGRYQPEHDAWIPFNCPASFVRQQYTDFLGRSADVAGTTFWTSRLHNGTTGSTVIRSFMGSSEFGAVVAPAVRAYLGVRGTYPPTKATVDAAVARLRSGDTPADLAQTYAEDPSVSGLSNNDFITHIYQNLFKRAPTTVERANDLVKLTTGTTRGTLVAGYAEGSAKTILSPEVNVAMVFLGMLGRAPDPSGWTYWVKKVKGSSTDALVTGFQRSDEYARRVG
ncbi:MAG: repeat-containing protein [Acidimicrobiales bacterium]|nr:repeat-containing protein [Acidimicrobiales bacterium]